MRDRRVEPRVEILAVALEAQDERLVVDAGAEERDLLERDAVSSASRRVVCCTEWQRPTIFVCGDPCAYAWQSIAIGFV